MANKKQTKNHKKQPDDALDFVKIDAYLIPAPQAEMYRVLREAVAHDLLEALTPQYFAVKRVADNPDEGEAIVVYLEDGTEKYRIYLNPTNISQAQKARDKDQLAKFIEHFETE